MTIKDVILKEIKGVWGNPPVGGELSTPVIKTNNMTYEGYIDYDDITYRSIPDNKITSCFLKRGDLLVEKSGGTKTHSVGYVNIFNKENDVFVCNNFIVGLRPDNTIILSEYLFFQMKYFYEIGIFSDCYNKTTGIQNLQLQTYLSKPIVCPEKAEQKKVVSTLSNIVKALDKKKEQLKKLDELIQSKFYEMFGDPVVNDKGWKVERLGKMGTLKNGLNYSQNEEGCTIRILSVSDFKDRFKIEDVTQLSTISLSQMPSDEMLLKDGDIVFVRSNGNKKLVGRSLLVYPRNEPTSFSGFCIRFRNNSKLIDNTFLVTCLKTDSIREKLFGRGANISNLNQTMLQSLVIPCPPLSLQQTYTSYVEKVEQAKAIVNQEIAHLQELLNSRMDYYFRK